MGFFKRLFQRTPAVTTLEPEDPSPPAPPRESLVLLLEGMPDLLKGLVQWRNLLQDPAAHFERLDGEYTGLYRSGVHRIRVEGKTTSLPREVQQRTIHFSHWPQSTKDTLYQHRAHLLCVYEGESTDPREQLLALYQLATAFTAQGLLAVADEVAFNVTPAQVLQEMFTPLTESDLQQDFPAELWTNLLKFHRPDGPIWYTTRGFERFGAPNFTLLDEPGRADRAFDLFTALLRYVVYHQAILAPGHTAELGNLHLHFREPYEYTDHLQGKGELLVVEILQGN